MNYYPVRLKGTDDLVALAYIPISLDDLAALDDAAQLLGKDITTLVITGWTKRLDIIRQVCTNMGYPYVKISGEPMSQAEAETLVEIAQIPVIELTEGEW